MAENGISLSLSEVAKRRKLLVRYGLWDRFESDSIDSWCHSFHSPESKLIATIALDSLIVRTKKSAEVAMWHFLCSVIPQVTSQNPSCWSAGSVPLKLLSQPNLFNIRIVRLEQPSRFGSGQSSDDIIRLLKYQFSVHKYYFSEPDKNSKIIIIDELSASGSQAGRAIQKWRQEFENEIFVYFLAIHSQGLKHLKTKFPDVTFYFAELLGRESTLTESLVSYGLANDDQEASRIIIDFTKEYFVKGNWSPLGFGKMSLCYRPAFTTCNNLAGLYLLETKDTHVSLCNRGIG